ncbi:MAG: SRPBCC family protein [Frankiaceae bacterium]|nr:SRPBCC family protein [Frankiaceae bacterium]MBV9871361.1 SRPBCC family protein [Frankiaceae bacterium]
MADKHLEVSETINADPTTLYELVANLPEMGKLSPENTGGKWVGGASGPEVGARFRGNNQAGWRRWSTSVKITEADPGKRFAFHVSFAGVPIADWTYEFEASGTLTTVREMWDDRRPGWMDKLSGVVMGVPDRPGHNQENMAQTLSNLKRLSEAAAP